MNAETKYLVLDQTGGVRPNECMTDSLLRHGVTLFFYAFLWRGHPSWCSNITFLHVRCSALHTLNKYYDVVTIPVTRITHIVHSKVLEKKENTCNSV